jgi:hypothetical protein
LARKLKPWNWKSRTNPIKILRTAVMALRVRMSEFLDFGRPLRLLCECAALHRHSPRRAALPAQGVAHGPFVPTSN